MITLPNNATIPASLTKPYDIAMGFLVQLEQAARSGDGEATVAGYFHTRAVQCCISKPNKRTGHRTTRWVLGWHGRASTPYGKVLDVLTQIEADRQAYEATEARRVPLKAEVSYIDGPNGDTPRVDLNGTRQLRLKGTYRYFGVGAIPRGGEGRKVDGGPLVPGPWAFAYGLATCLMSDAYAEQKARDEADRQGAIEVEQGSKLLIDGVWYRVDVDYTARHLSLVAVS